MIETHVMKIVREEILQHLSLDIKQHQLSNSHIIIQLQYKGNDIGQAYTIQSRLKWYTDRGHGGGSFVDGTELLIKKLE